METVAPRRRAVFALLGAGLLAILIGFVSTARAELAQELPGRAADLRTAQAGQFLRARWNVPVLRSDDLALIQNFDEVEAAYEASQGKARLGKADSGGQEPAPLRTTIDARLGGGWRTDLERIEHPSVYTEGCLSSGIKAGNIPLAERYAEFMLSRLVVKNGAGFWYFPADCAVAPGFEVKAPWCSGLAQGQGLVALAALHSITGKDEYGKAAEAVFRSYLVPVKNGGFARIEGDAYWPEEYPTRKLSGVLNGGSVALLALHDYWVLTGERKAKELFDRGIRTLESRISEYETVAPSFPEIASTYSLVRVPPMLLVHILPRGSCFVSRVALLANGKPFNEAVVGSPQDDNLSADAYVWVDHIFQTWGDREVTAGRECRNAFGYPQGKYAHAPISLRCPGEPEPGVVYTLAVEYRSPADVPPSALEAYAPGRYWPVMSLPSTGGEWRTVTGALPAAVVEKTFAQDPQASIHVPYLNRNAILVLAMADVSGSAILEQYGIRWLSSAAYVPAKGRYYPRPGVFERLNSQTALAVLQASDESKRIGEPSVAGLSGGALLMCYSAVGEDGKSRILSATSEDSGDTWTRQGPAIPDSAIAGGISSPQLIWDKNASDPNRRYRLYFTARPASDKGPSGLAVAYSSDGLRWSRPVSVLQVNTRHLSVARDALGAYHVYYLSPSAGRPDEPGVVIEHAVSPDGERWSAPQSVYAGKGAESWVVGIRAFGIGPYTCILYTLHTSAADDETYLLFSKDGRQFHEALSDPVHTIPSWNTRRQSAWTFWPDVLAPNSGPLVFFGEGGSDPESSDRINCAKFDSELLLQKIEETLRLLSLQ